MVMAESYFYVPTKMTRHDNMTDHSVQKGRGQTLLFSFEYNLLPNLISNFNHYMDKARIFLINFLIQTVLCLHSSLTIWFSK